VNIPDSIPLYSDRERFSILFVGVFSHAPNVDAVAWLCSEIFPRLLERCPEASLHIIGRNPPAVAYEAAQNNGAVHLHGYVESIEEYYRRMSVSIAPVRMGGGIRTKILHAQGYGLPVVATPMGVEGILGSGSDNICIANSVDGIVTAILDLFFDPARAARIGESGRENVKKYYSWDRVVGELEELYRQEVGRRAHI
jgi:glycosyltransferase involved in cell wall biosynthesis